MKKIIFISLFATLFITACKKEIAETEKATETSLTNSVNAPVNCTGNTWGDQQLYKGSFINPPLTYNNKAYLFEVYKHKLFIYDGTNWDSLPMLTPFNQNPTFVFTIGSKGYLGYTPPWDGPVYGLVAWLWQYDFIAKSWSSKAPYPGLADFYQSTFTIGNKGYVVGGTETQPNNGSHRSINDTWEYNQATNSWTQKADLPFFGVSAGTGFSIGNKGYVVNGYYKLNLNPGVNLSDLYEYNPATNAWSFKTSFPGAKRHFTNVFVIGQAAYAGGGVDSPFYTEGLKDYYKYSPATNAWVSVANFPSHEPFFSCFSINSRGYVSYRIAGTNNSAPAYMLKYTPKTCTLQGTSQ